MMNANMIHTSTPKCSPSTSVHRRSVQGSSVTRCHYRWSTRVSAASTSSSKPPSSSTNTSADDFGLDAGWGVAVPTEPSQAAAAAKPAKKGKKAPAAKEGSKKAGKKGSKQPYFSLSNEEGVLGLALLQAKLAQEEGSELTGEQLRQQIDSRRNKRAKMPPLPSVNTAALARKSRANDELASLMMDADDDDDEGEESSPEFQLTIGDDGMEYVEYDKQGKVRRRQRQGDAMKQWVDETDVDRQDDALDVSNLETVMEDFDQFGWEQFDDGEEEQAQQDGVAGLIEDGEDSIEARALRDMANDDDWGLEELGKRPSTYLAEIEARQAKLGKAANDVQWGGSVSATGIDMEEQEAVLNRYMKEHDVKKMLKIQQEIEDNIVEMKRKASSRNKMERKMHSQLKIIGGSVTGRYLVSSQGAGVTRPMMEKVRSAIFDMILAQAGTVNRLPPGARWLDVFAGTGSVGLEGLSRGAAECHFVEVDPWVTRTVLGKNITTCGFNKKSVVHNMRAEDFLAKAVQYPKYAGGAFDFVSLCPPYMLVSYPELFDLFDRSQLLHEGSIMFVEYPKQLRNQVPETLGPLEMVRDRKYGRTCVAVYAAPPSE